MKDTTVSTRFLILSDTHDLDLITFAYPTADVILHCGDLTENGGIDAHQKAIAGLASIQGELKLVIAGNHDVDLDSTYSDAQSCQPVETLWSSAIEQGIHYLKEGTYTFTLSSGATFSVYASPRTPAYGISAFQYPSEEDRYNRCSPEHAKNVCTEQSFIPDGVDILLTHGRPKYILDQCADPFQSSGGCEHLRRAVCRVRPRLHCFGHIHSAWGARRAQWPGSTIAVDDDDDDIDLLPLEFVGRNSSKKKGYARLSPSVYEQCKVGEQTLFINAAIGNNDGQMENLPWVVDIDLDRVTEAGNPATENQ